MSENNTLNVSILVAICLVIVRKVAKLLQKRESECGLSTPCFNVWFDLENQNTQENGQPHPTSQETTYDADSETDDVKTSEEGDSSSIEEKSSTYSDSNSLTEHMNALDSLDFIELESKLMKLVVE